MTANKRALITGITGQDGSYLTEYLIGEGYEVHGVVRRSSLFNTDRIDHLYQDPHEQDRKVRLHYGDLSDGTGIRRVLEEVEPHEVYNLGAQSHVMVSFQQPEYTADVDGLGTLRLLEAVRDFERKADRQVRFYQAGTSEMFGASMPPQSENTPFHPRSPYACAKLYAHWQTVNYRESYGMFAANGILFNHESPRRGETFLTRKVTRAATRISLGLQDKVYLGNLEAERDWGHARDFVRAMHLIVQADLPSDWVVATGQTRTVKEFVEHVFSQLELDWRDHVEIDPRYFRPAEVEALLGDASRIKSELGWEPEISFAELVDEMVAHDLELARREQVLSNAGHMVAARGAASQ